MKEVKAIGKIINYDGTCGEIITEKDKYLLFNENTKEPVQNGDLVVFRPEQVKTKKIAFFIKKYK